jgi:hypothetical protein
MALLLWEEGVSLPFLEERVTVLCGFASLMTLGYFKSALAD